MLFGNRSQGAPGLLSAPAVAPMQNLAPAPASPFVWGDGGAQMTPEEIARRRALAAKMGQPDFSPVGHWTQGLGRVVTGLMAGLENRKLNKASAANTDHSKAIMQALLGGKSDAVTAALVDPTLSDEVRGFAKMQWERANPKPVNNDTVADYQFISKTLGPEAGKQYLQSKANPIQWIQAANPDGTKQLIPMGPNGPLTMGGGGPASTAGAPPTTLPPDFQFEEGGPGAAQPRAGFQR